MRYKKLRCLGPAQDVIMMGMQLMFAEALPLCNLLETRVGDGESGTPGSSLEQKAFTSRKGQ
jgi:hypothetical protein